MIILVRRITTSLTMTGRRTSTEKAICVRCETPICFGPGATPKPSTQMTQTRSASYEKRRRWFTYLRRTCIRYDASGSCQSPNSIPSSQGQCASHFALVRRTLVMCVAPSAICDAHFPATQASMGRGMCVAHYTRCDAHL